MKRALLLLVIVCLLFAAQSLAAAYEPTNGFALEANTYANKIVAKEEVAAPMLSENWMPLVQGKNAWSRQYIMLVLAINFGVAVAYILSPSTEDNYMDRRYNTRFCGFT